MFTGNFLCTSFKVELLKGVHDFSVGGHTFKVALYGESAALNAATTAYTTSGEIPSAGGYTAGGLTLTQLEPASDGTTAVGSFAEAVIPEATLSARGALIYNSSVAGNPAVMVLDFGALRAVSGQDFRLQFPPLTAAAAILRIA